VSILIELVFLKEGEPRMLALEAARASIVLHSRRAHEGMRAET
jgi:hypothetical protein